MLRSSLLTEVGGIRAIFEMMASMSTLPMTVLASALGLMRCAAPASSMTSMALSGRWRSVMYLADSSAAAVSAAPV